MMHFQYKLKQSHSSKNICPGGHEIYKLDRPFLGHYYFILSLPDPCSGEDKKIVREIHQFYNFLSPYSTDSTEQIG